MRLHFDAALARRLLDHSKAAPSRSPTLEQLFEGRYRKDGADVDPANLGPGDWPTEADIDPAKLTAGLWLVGDQGIYLMSNGKPGLLVDPGTSRNVVAMAMESDPATRPDTWWDVKRLAFGGDDGVVFLDLRFAEGLLQAARFGRVCIDLSPSAAKVVTPSQPALAR